MNASIDKVDWAILDSLCDDYESIEQIIPAVREVEPTADETFVIDKVGRLLIAGFICTMGKYDAWYGMTAKGCEIWEENSRAFSEDPPDWSQSWTIDVDYKTERGFAIGTTKEVCESAIANHAGMKIVVDPSTFVHSTVEEFDAKYYKKLKSGHRIDFAFAKKEA